MILINDIEAIIISNTSDVSRDKLKNIQKHQKGGISGKPLLNYSNQVVKNLDIFAKDKLQIIGLGGISNANTILEKFQCGADAVQLYTSLVYNGMGLIENMLYGLIDIYKDHESWEAC